ncbi:NAD(P)-dependent oxidoreductase [Paracoccus sp. MBLB3053]|uniref:NAD(P)-dependent oxidoreductase n=1 Tax=Paracoccus aurantius TaxID=3073814 RepID=A0ABU2HX52_9RHOB|nr:NAD(P)-dependent oxidoreductase [Paracoccus sp. MBLB3053]MDS9469322.1 NAD(P)-dependent oxidoreductase [Paracoccus sp. MBLB3053]
MSFEPMQGVYLSADFDLKKEFGAAFAQLSGDIRIDRPSEIEDAEKVRFAICWKPGPGTFDTYPNLGFAAAVGAGVDSLLGHPGLPPDLPVCRVRDPDQALQMAGYVAHEILHLERDFPLMEANARKRIWAPPALRAPSEVRVAILGHGSMGEAVVRAVHVLGFSVVVACRSTPKSPISGVKYHSGPNSILQAASGADYLVNVLPLTNETRDILDRRIFDQMARGGHLIQIGRGEHMPEADLIAALEAGQLSGATLDVFRSEPLATDHPFWSEPRLRLTPHVASTATPRVVAEQILCSAQELRDGLPLSFAIDRVRGY